MNREVRRVPFDFGWPIGKVWDGYLPEDPNDEEFVGEDPPHGDAWQLWETTTEGSPMSPVFATRDGLVDWLVANGPAWHNSPISRTEAEDFVDGGLSFHGFLMATAAADPREPLTARPKNDQETMSGTKPEGTPRVTPIWMEDTAEYRAAMRRLMQVGQVGRRNNTVSMPLLNEPVVGVVPPNRAARRAAARRAKRA